MSHDRLVFVSHCPVGLCEGVKERVRRCVCEERQRRAVHPSF